MATKQAANSDGEEDCAQYKLVVLGNGVTPSSALSNIQTSSLSALAI